MDNKRFIEDYIVDYENKSNKLWLDSNDIQDISDILNVPIAYIIRLYRSIQNTEYINYR